MKNKNAVALGKKSAKVRKEKNGHDSNYYRELAKKRWEKEKQTVDKSQILS